MTRIPNERDLKEAWNLATRFVNRLTDEETMDLTVESVNTLRELGMLVAPHKRI